MKSLNHIQLYKYLLVIILLSSGIVSNAQEENKDNSIVTDIIVIDGDTLPLIELSEVRVFAPYIFKSKKQKRQYNRLTRYVKKVYPYAKLASEKLNQLKSEIDTIQDEKAIKRHIKQVDKELRAEYGDELKKLTIMQGRILIKLVDRETGSTSYELLKQLRGPFSAFMWQSLARLFGENLKSEYDPEEEDKMIEHIVLMIENGQL